MTINGRVSYQDIEGGFWGIIGSDGSKYVPVEPLPDAFRKDGLRITAEIETVHMFGTTMWGAHIRIVSICLP